MGTLGGMTELPIYGSEDVALTGGRSGSSSDFRLSNAAHRSSKRAHSSESNASAGFSSRSRASSRGQSEASIFEVGRARAGVRVAI